MDFSTPPARRELIGVAVCTMVGACLRLWSFGALGLTHFDEGIYALSGVWSVLPGGVYAIDPGVIPYAPPGFPLLIGLSYQLLGVADTAAIFAATLLGIAAIPLTAWVARRTFGPGAGLAAAIFICLSVSHIAFSRKALTDSPLVFLWLLAMGLGGRFLERPGIGRALAMGLAVGLAQNFKYNGWISGVVILLAALVAVVLVPASRRRASLLPTFGYGLVAVIVAALMYVPWFQFVERNGGYADLLRHQRSYLGTSGDWLRFWKQQLAQVVALSGGRPWGVVTWALALIGFAWVLNGGMLAGANSRQAWGRLAIGLIAGAGAVIGVGSVSWWIGLLVVPRLLLDERPSFKILAVWWILLSIMTPFYHPYARLWLPLEACGWMLLSGAIASIVSSPATSKSPHSRPSLLGETRWAPVCIAGAFAIALVLQPASDPFPLGRIFGPTTTIRNGLAQLIISKIPGLSPEAEVHVLGRRPLVYYLTLQGRFRLGIEANLSSLLASVNRGKWGVIDTVQVWQEMSPLWQEMSLQKTKGVIERQANRLRLWSGELDPITLLDVQPAAAISRKAEVSSEGWLVRIESP